MSLENVKVVKMAYKYMITLGVYFCYEMPGLCREMRAVKLCGAV